MLIIAIRVVNQNFQSLNRLGFLSGGFSAMYPIPFGVSFGARYDVLSLSDASTQLTNPFACNIKKSFISSVGTEEW